MLPLTPICRCHSIVFCPSSWCRHGYSIAIILSLPPCLWRHAVVISPSSHWRHAAVLIPTSSYYCNQSNIGITLLSYICSKNHNSSCHNRHATKVMPLWSLYCSHFFVVIPTVIIPASSCHGIHFSIVISMSYLCRHSISIIPSSHCHHHALSSYDQHHIAKPSSYHHRHSCVVIPWSSSHRLDIIFVTPLSGHSDFSIVIMAVCLFHCLHFPWRFQCSHALIYLHANFAILSSRLHRHTVISMPSWSLRQPQSFSYHHGRFVVAIPLSSCMSCVWSRARSLCWARRFPLKMYPTALYSLYSQVIAKQQQHSH